MRGFELKLHALREEIVDFICECQKKYEISIFAQQFTPFEAFVLSPMEAKRLSEKTSKVTRVMFTVDKPIFPVMNQFPSEYPDSLFLFLPKNTDVRIDQIVLGFNVKKGDSYNKKAVDTWNLIHRDLKKLTKNGLKAKFIISGQIRDDKNDRVTIGAERFFA